MSIAMNSSFLKTGFVLSVLLAAAAAHAERNFGLGVKAGTLGLGVEGTWRPVPYFDLRIGANGYDYDDDGSQAGVNYDATLELDTVYATANLRFPLSPFRVTAGLVSNGNEFKMASTDAATFDLGGTVYTAADVGNLTSTTSFESTAPYVGIGYDFSMLGKVGLNFDLGLLWQGDPNVTLGADGLLANDPGFQAALEAERVELVDEMKDFRAWPVVSLGFVVNF